MQDFRIKYSLFDKYLNEMKTMSLEEIEYEFSSIYGQFTFEVSDYQYQTFYDQGVIPEEFLTSELVDTHFGLLLSVVTNLDQKTKVYTKYIDNSWTWLKFEIDESTIKIQELECYDSVEDEGFSSSVVIGEHVRFERAKHIHGPFIVEKVCFLEEYNGAIKRFIDDLRSANELILESKHLRNLMKYYFETTRSNEL